MKGSTCSVLFWNENFLSVQAHGSSLHTWRSLEGMSTRGATSKAGKAISCNNETMWNVSQHVLRRFGDFESLKPCGMVQGIKNHTEFQKLTDWVVQIYKTFAFDKPLWSLAAQHVLTALYDGVQAELADAQLTAEWCASVEIIGTWLKHGRNMIQWFTYSDPWSSTPPHFCCECLMVSYWKATNMTTSRWLPKLLSKSTLERTALQAIFTMPEIGSHRKILLFIAQWF